jgi:hypothetical protein
VVQQEIEGFEGPVSMCGSRAVVPDLERDAQKVPSKQRSRIGDGELARRVPQARQDGSLLNRHQIQTAKILLLSDDPA